MATSQTTAAPRAPKTNKEPAKLTDRIKSQLNAAALKGKLPVDDLSDLEQHIKKIAALLGA